MTARTTTAPEHDSLPAALAAFQADLPRIGKTETATIPGKDGGRGYSYKYADLHDVTHAVVPMLARHGLSFTACPTIQGDRFVLAYMLTHTSGGSIDGAYPLPDPTRTTAQAVGSAITYARRYALAAVTGVVPDEDDDGAAATPAERMAPPLPEHVTKTLEHIASLAPDKRESLREWVAQEGHGPTPGAWSEEVCTAIRRRAHQIGKR